jgi:gag-polypeptide of LTR copia-type
MSGNSPTSPNSPKISMREMMEKLNQMTSLMMTSFERIAQLEENAKRDAELKASAERQRITPLGGIGRGREIESLPMSPSHGGGSNTEEESESSKLHGIRAQQSWMSQAIPPKELVKIPFKLESPIDYGIWKFSMRKVLETQGLAGFIDGTITKPADSPEVENSSQLILKWQQLNTATEALIMGGLGKSQIARVIQCKSAREIWLKLEGLYQHKSDVNIARLESDLHALKWKRNSTVDSFIQEIDTITETLRGCGVEIADSTLRLILLKGLPDRLESVKHILLQSGSKNYLELCDDLRSHVGLSGLGDSKAYLGSGEGPSEPRLP